MQAKERNRPLDLGERRLPELAALEHPAALVVGDHLVEELLLELPVVEVVLVDGIAERLLGEVRALPE
jgi:hypothetical protein